MDYRGKFLTAFGLILLLLVGKISIFDEDNVEESRIKESKIKPFTFKNDICSLYDNLSVIDYMLFGRNYKPLVLIIADQFIDGINRVRNLSDSKRILNDDGIKDSNYYSQFYDVILQNIYLFEVNDTYYFIYPVDFQDHFLTIYFQWKLLHNNLGITFDFVNVKKESPFYEDILIPLEPSCTNCALVKYVNEKLRKGESFSELFELRKKLFRKKETKNLSFTAVNDYDICDSIGFNINSQSMSSLLHFNSLLKQIQINSKSIEKSKKRSLICFQSRYLEVTEDVVFGDIRNELHIKDRMIVIDYLNWINNTILSLKSNDNSFGSLCETKHKIEILELFCFMNKISDVTSHNKRAWIEALKEHVVKPLTSKLKWFNSLKILYTNEYTMYKNRTYSALANLNQEMLNVTANWKDVMNMTYQHFMKSLSVNTNYNYDHVYFSICFIYKYWEIVDDLLLEVKFKRLVIIVVDDMKQGIRIAKQIRGNRVVPKVMREDLHYSKQFLYDFIMKHIYLVQSYDTYYYVYPMTADRHRDSLISYVEYKMIKDYSNVVFYFVNSSNYFSLDERIRFDNNNLVIPALPDFCNLTSEKCITRFINPTYLMKVHQVFVERYPKYLSLYASFYNNLTEFINNDDSLVKNTISYRKYSQKFYVFLNKKEVSYDTKYLFRGLPCLLFRKLNNKTHINFNITKYSNVFEFYSLTNSAYKNITSINDGNKTNLKSLCSNKQSFKFLKFFCFLKINYIDDMSRVIGQESDTISSMRSIAANEKNIITKYLLKTMAWIQKLLSMDYIDYKYNETRMIKETDAFYSQIPKITFNGTDLSNKIYSIFKNITMSMKCKELASI